jgi:acyl dehydratase
MPLDPSLVGHETNPQTGTITDDAVRQFADAIHDTNPIFHDPAAAERAGFADIPTPPTFITRFRVAFAEAGLDPERSQVLHGEQEYTYTRPLVVGDTLTVRHRIASLRQSARAGGMAIMTLEQLADAPDGQQVALGKATLIVRDTPPESATGEAGTVASGAGAGASAGKQPATPQGAAIPTLVKHVTQEQINAYADASGDHNPIHLDPAKARAVGLSGTIAHGMLSMAFVGQTLTDWLTAQQGSHGWVARLRVRFQAMAYPGDTLHCHGALGAKTVDGRQRIDLWIENQRGERLTTGDADVMMG